MINLAHWGLPQYLLVLLVAFMSYADIQTLPPRVREKVKNGAAHPLIVNGTVLIVSLLHPVLLICLVSWGGFFG